MSHIALRLLLIKRESISALPFLQHGNADLVIRINAANFISLYSQACH